MVKVTFVAFRLSSSKLVLEAKKKSKIMERVLTGQTVLRNLLVGAFTVRLGFEKIS